MERSEQVRSQMTLIIELGVVFVALNALTAFVVLAAHFCFGKWLRSLTAKWRARLGVMFLFAPLAIGTLGIATTLLPSVLNAFGWGTDHCLNALGHDHSHLCIVHPPTTTTSMTALLGVLVGGVTLCVLSKMAGVFCHWRRSHQRFNSLLATSSVHRLTCHENMVDSDVPFCLSTGFWRPQIYV
jgi:hypothetical protein